MRSVAPLCLHRHNPAGQSGCGVSLSLHLERACCRLAGPERTECRLIGFAAPCWIFLDQYNRVEMDKDYNFVSTKPIGSVRAAFLREIAVAIKQAARSVDIRAVKLI